MRDIEELITEEFEALHQLLREEESARLAALRKEKEEKMQMLREMTGKMRRQVSTLTDAIKAIAKHLEAEGVSFVQVNIYFFSVCIFVKYCIFSWIFFLASVIRLRQQRQTVK